MKLSFSCISIGGVWVLDLLLLPSCPAVEQSPLHHMLSFFLSFFLGRNWSIFLQRKTKLADGPHRLLDLD
jgi:hypothetical protein